MSSDSNVSMKNIEKLLENLPENALDIFSSLIKNDDSKGLDIKSKDDFGGLEMIMNVKRLMDRMNNSCDVRADLIKALHPFLRPSRQEKIQKCIKALRISNFCREASTLTTSQRNSEVTGE
jgi:hypothetical protein